MVQDTTFYYHDGAEDFPHGAGASDAGWYVYFDAARQLPPDGPFPSRKEAEEAARRKGA